MSLTKHHLGESASPRPVGRSGLLSAQWRGRLAWLAVFAVAGVVLLLVYLQVARRAGFGSDGSVIIQQSWDFAHGNPLLRGWLLPDITFYTIEIPEFAVVELVHGAVDPVVLQFGEALNLTLFVLLAALAAKGSATGREGAARALIAAGILLAPIPGPNYTLMLGNPDHLATQLALLVVWIILDRAQPRWWVPVIVTALLAWARVSDEIVLLEGEIPLLTVCVMRMLKRRGPLRGQWYDMSLAGAAIAAEAIARLTLRLVRDAGGFTAFPLQMRLAPFHTLFSHIRVTIDSTLILYGANFPGTVGANAPTVMAAVRLVGVLLAVVAFVYGMRRIFVDDLMVQLLTVAVGASVVAYTIIGSPSPVGGAHDVMPVLTIGAVLAGRLDAGLLLRRPAIRPAAISVLTVWLALSMVFVARDAVQPLPANPSLRLAAWLADHHLTYGLANYYAASLVSVDSGGQVMVAPINRRGGHLVMSPWNSTTSWYDPASHDATFFIANRMNGCPADDAAIWLADAGRAFGPPAHRYSVDGSVVETWRGNLLRVPLKHLPMHRPSPC